MITRTYVVKFAESEGALAPVDILVQDDPGTQDAPVVPASGVAYYEMLGRAVRFETVAADLAAGGFVPRLRLGFAISIFPLSSSTALPPSVQLSASLASLASSDGTTIPVAAFPDPSGKPAIRLLAGDTTGSVFVVSLQIVEPKDVDRSGTASP